MNPKKRPPTNPSAKQKNDSQPATKANLKAVRRDIQNLDKQLRGEIQNMDKRLGGDIQNLDRKIGSVAAELVRTQGSMADMKEELIRLIHDGNSKIMRMLEQVVLPLNDQKRTNLVYGDILGEHKLKLDSHERRLTVLEST